MRVKCRTATQIPGLAWPIKKDLPIAPIVQKPLGLNAQVRLLGMTFTLLAYSPFADDPMRLISKKSDARIRQAKSLETTAAHLKVYRPDIAIIDVGLPDGCNLILTSLQTRLPVPQDRPIYTVGKVDLLMTKDALSCRTVMPAVAPFA